MNGNTQICVPFLTESSDESPIIHIYFANAYSSFSFPFHCLSICLSHCAVLLFFLFCPLHFPILIFLIIIILIILILIFIF